MCVCMCVCVHVCAHVCGHGVPVWCCQNPGHRRHLRWALCVHHEGLLALCCRIHTQTVVIRNANNLPGIALRNAPGIGIAPRNVRINQVKHVPECSEISPGLPGAISEHSGSLFVLCIGTFMGAISIPETFLKAISDKIFAFPVTTVCV